MFKISLLQGANATFLGKREPAVYGSTTVDELNAMLHRDAQEKGYSLDIFYTNVEGETINRIYRAVDERVDGLVMNLAGFTYAGYALKDYLTLSTPEGGGFSGYACGDPKRKSRCPTAPAPKPELQVDRERLSRSPRDHGAIQGRRTRDEEGGGPYNEQEKGRRSPRWLA